MKKFIVDKSLILICGLCIYVYLLSKLPFAMEILFKVILLWTIYILCKELLFLPIDHVFGKKQEVFYFSRVDGLIHYEFFPDAYYREWLFYNSDKTIRLLVLIPCTKENVSQMEQPLVDEKIVVTYYPFSKILVSWNRYVQKQKGSNE